MRGNHEFPVTVCILNPKKNWGHRYAILDWRHDHQSPFLRILPVCIKIIAVDLLRNSGGPGPMITGVWLRLRSSIVTQLCSWSCLATIWVWNLGGRPVPTEKDCRLPQPQRAIKHVPSANHPRELINTIEFICACTEECALKAVPDLTAKLQLRLTIDQLPIPILPCLWPLWVSDMLTTTPSRHWDKDSSSSTLPLWNAPHAQSPLKHRRGDSLSVCCVG